MYNGTNEKWVNGEVKIKRHTQEQEISLMLRNCHVWLWGGAWDEELYLCNFCLYSTTMYMITYTSLNVHRKQTFRFTCPNTQGR